MFVARESGIIVAVYGAAHPGLDLEELPDDDEELRAFINPEPESVTVLYPVDLWSRLTNAEADQVEAAMATQPVRVQNIFRSASSYRSDHELWPLLVSMAANLFGSERAAEILAAS